jgi:hypothetical protein
MELNPMTPIGERIRQIIPTRELWGDDTDEEILAIGLVAGDTSFRWIIDRAQIRYGTPEHKTYTQWLKGYWNREMHRRSDGRRPSTKEIARTEAEHKGCLRVHP